MVLRECIASLVRRGTMFNSLLESRPRRTSRLGGGIISTMSHLALIAGMVAATANAGVARAEPEAHTVVYTAPTPPPPPPPAPVIDRVLAPPAAAGFTVIIAPIEIPDVIPPIDFTKELTNEGA